MIYKFICFRYADVLEEVRKIVFNTLAVCKLGFESSKVNIVSFLIDSKASARFLNTSEYEVFKLSDGTSKVFLFIFDAKLPHCVEILFHFPSQFFYDDKKNSKVYNFRIDYIL